MGGRNIKDRKLVKTDADSYVGTIERDSFRRAVALPGDIIVSALFDRRKLYVYRQSDPPAVVNSSCAIIRSGEQSGYISSYLRTIQGQREFLDKATRATAGAFIPRLSTRDLAAIQVPILPLAELERLSDARIETATSSELLALKNELLAAKKELESKDEEIAGLKAKHEEAESFLQDRIRAAQEQMDTNSLTTRIRHGETAALEFKSSLRWNIRSNRQDRSIENAVLKTVAAFTSPFTSI